MQDKEYPSNVIDDVVKNCYSSQHNSVNNPKKFKIVVKTALIRFKRT